MLFVGLCCRVLLFELCRLMIVVVCGCSASCVMFLLVVVVGCCLFVVDVCC